MVCPLSYSTVNTQACTQGPFFILGTQQAGPWDPFSPHRQNSSWLGQGGPVPPHCQHPVCTCVESISLQRDCCHPMGESPPTPS